MSFSNVGHAIIFGRVSRFWPHGFSDGRYAEVVPQARPPVKVRHIKGGMCFIEHRVLQHLRAATEAYCSMDDLGPYDVCDFSTMVRTLGRHIMARVAQRGMDDVERA